MLAVLAALGSLAVHMVVPALPSISRDLQIPAVAAQLTIGTYLVGLATGQLLGGPLSDLLGRRPVALTGVALFCTGSVLAGCAQSTPLLLTARVIQALGGAIGLMSARAVVSDISGDDTVTDRMATLTSVALLSPLLAPTLGGAVVQWSNWRGIFALLGLTSAAVGAFLMLRLPESLPRAARLSSVRAILPSYLRLVRNRRFLRFAAANAAASSALYIFLGGSSFLLIGRWGLSAGAAGLFYLSVTTMGLIGTLCVRVVERRIGALRAGLAAMMAGSVLMVVLAFRADAGPVSLLIPMMIMCGGSGMAAPASLSGAMRAEDGVTGTAASLAGGLQMLASAVASSIVFAWAPGSFTVMAVAMASLIALACAIAPLGRASLAR